MGFSRGEFPKGLGPHPPNPLLVAEGFHAVAVMTARRAPKPPGTFLVSLGNAQIQHPAKGSAYTLETAALLLSSFPPRLVVLLWPGPPSPSSPRPWERCKGAHWHRPGVLRCAQSQIQVTTTSFPLLSASICLGSCARHLEDTRYLQPEAFQGKRRHAGERGGADAATDPQGSCVPTARDALPALARLVGMRSLHLAPSFAGKCTAPFPVPPL